MAISVKIPMVGEKYFNPTTHQTKTRCSNFAAKKNPHEPSSMKSNWTYMQV